MTKRRTSEYEFCAFFIHVKNTYFEVLWCLSEFMIFVTLRNTNHLNKNEYENKINYRS